MKALCLFLLLFAVIESKSQHGDLNKVIKEVFYTPEVYSRIFVDYKGVGEPPLFFLPAGKYCFILPDTAFQRVKPDIMEQLTMTWPRESKLFTLTYIKEPNGIVFVKDPISFDQNIDFFVVFDRILINKKSAQLTFHTSTYYATGIDKLIHADCLLKKKGHRWKVKKVSMTSRKHSPQPD